MAISIHELTEYLQNLLQPQLWQDYCPNGLQVSGGDKAIKKLVSGVTACQELLESAIAAKADAIIVHHGYFWKGENPCIVGIKYQRLAALIKNNVHLLAYHLPLDGHVDFGNNVQLAKQLDFVVTNQFGSANGPFGLVGQLQQKLSGLELSHLIASRLGRQPLHIPGKNEPIQTIAWCTGAAQDFIDYAISLKVDAYLTGEVSERTVHIARESGIHFYAAGHHATEKYGIQALGDHLAEKYNLIHRFINIENPV